MNYGGGELGPLSRMFSSPPSSQISLGETGMGDGGGGGVFHNIMSRLLNHLMHLTIIGS